METVGVQVHGVVELGVLEALRQSFFLNEIGFYKTLTMI